MRSKEAKEAKTKPTMCLHGEQSIAVTNNKENKMTQREEKERNVKTKRKTRKEQTRIMAGRRRRTKHQQMKEQYNLLHRLPRPLSPRPSEPTLLPTTLPSLIQYNMATSCVAGQTLPASLPACQPAVPVRRRCCLPSLQCAHTLKAPCPPGHSLIPVYPTTRSHLPPLQQTKVLPKLHLPYSLLELLFYYHPVLIRLQAASCLPEVQDSHPLPFSTRLTPVHPNSPPGPSSTTTNKAPYSRVAILL